MQVVTRFDLELPLSASGAIQFRRYFPLEFYDFGFSHGLGRLRLYVVSEVVVPLWASKQT
jgi:hypothetical protein